MNAIIPDTLQGALILSVIDFFLSFVIIAGIGVVLKLLPLLNRFASTEDKHGHKHSHGKRHGHGAPKAAVAAMPAGNASDQHVAAISAAVATVVGPHTIVQIERSN